MGTDISGHHTSSRFNDELEGVRARILQMGGLVERQLEQALASLMHGDSRLIALVSEEEREVNQLERLVDEDCSRILATRGPAAVDLRLIIAILKAATDLERIGDEGKKIAKLAARMVLLEHPPHRFGELRHLGRSVAAMLHDALDAFARMDAEAALAVARRDRLVDEEYEAIQRQCITFMMEDPRTIRRALDVMWVVRALERVGDHSKNICEHVIYVVHGKDVRHTKLEEVERQLSERRSQQVPEL